MNNRITNKKNKVNKNRNFFYSSIPDEIISIIENSRFKYKEGLYRILGFLLYRSAYGYSMRISQAAIAYYLGLTRTYVSEVIGYLRDLKLLFLTYGTQKRKGIYCHQPSTYTISPLLRNADANFQSKLCYLYPFLAKVSFTFFNVLGNLRKAVANKLKEIKSTLYNKDSFFIKSSYKDIQERSKKGSKNGVENPIPGKAPSSIKNILANLILSPKIPTPEVRPNIINQDISD
jgi:hypothetical protein